KREYQRAIEYGQTAMATAERLGDTRLLSWSYNALGNVYRDLGRDDEAITAYERAIALDPQSAYPHNGLGNVYRDLGRHDEALAEYERAIALDPASALFYQSLAEIYHLQRDYIHAKEAYDESLKRLEQRQPHIGLAGVYRHLGNY